MKELNPTIEMAPGGDLSVERTIAVDDEVVVEGPGHSITGQFAVAMFNLMAQPEVEQMHKIRTFDQDVETVGGSINNSVVPVELNLNNRNSNRVFLNESGEQNRIFVIDSDEPLLRGLFKQQNGKDGNEPGTIFLHKPDFDNQGLVTGETAVDWTGETVSDPGEMGIYNPREYGFRREGGDQIEDWQVRLSRVTDATSIYSPLTIAAIDHKFDVGGRNIAQPTSQTNQSAIEVSADFSNNTGSDITVESVGLDARFEGKRWALARDINQFTISNASTVNVFYRLRSDNSGGGGIMEHFMRMLYKEAKPFNNFSVDLTNASSTSRQVNDIREYHFTAVGPGGLGGIESPGDFHGKDFGPVIGKSTNTVNNSQVRLADRIDHGTGTDEVIHHGSYIERPLVRDISGNSFRFNVIRLFENRSGSFIDINETGLYANAGDDDKGLEKSAMIARHVLSSTETLANGEILELTYTFEVSV